MMQQSTVTGLRVAGFVVVALFAQATHAVVLTFDDLPDPGIYAGPPIPNGYGGLNWSNFYYVDTTAYTALHNTGYQFGTVSGTRVAYNAWGDVAVTSGNAFNFKGAYLTGAWNNGLNITVNGYNNYSLVYSTTVIVDSTGPTWFDFNYQGVDSISFSSYGGVPAGYAAGNGTHFAMDNFTYSPVPIPAAVWLFGSGLLWLTRLGRRRRWT